MRWGMVRDLEIMGGLLWFIDEGACEGVVS